MSIGAFFLAHT